ncbi:MAG: hypothetical protein HKN21_01930 [Candidatus Eisenbacteria bacterium]|uniref:Uncharacterized protein n=1 Tax=Eiseniibacteriota bacterium TaxID=2212470 RepID=A0A7Y2H1C8_UNCEI|nr:hypothetical protein [Candidatus Eisenbacteria bacterium]
MDVTVRETVNASKEKFGPKDLAKVFEDATKVIVAKGKKVVTFDMKKVSTKDAEFQKAVIGPSGNLRAPSIRTGKTMFVGFSEDAYGERFSK